MGRSRISAHPKDSSLTPKIDVVDCTSMDANVNGIRHSCSKWSPAQIPNALNLKPPTPDKLTPQSPVRAPLIRSPYNNPMPKPSKPEALSCPKALRNPRLSEAISTSTPTSSRTSTSWSPKAPPPIGGAAGGPGGPALCTALLWGSVAECRVRV